MTTIGVGEEGRESGLNSPPAQMTTINRDGDSQSLTSFLHQQIKGAFATKFECLKSELRKERDSLTMGMESELSRIETFKSKITQFGVLESDESVVLGAGKIICTAKMAALRNKRKLCSKFLAINGGPNVDSALTTRWTEHTNPAIHRICYEHAKDLKVNQMTHAQAAALAREGAVTSRLVNLRCKCESETSVTGSTSIPLGFRLPMVLT